MMKPTLPAPRPSRSPVASSQLDARRIRFLAGCSTTPLLAGIDDPVMVDPYGQSGSSPGQSGSPYW